VLARLASLRQHQRHGHRSPHKPLLVLVALGRLVAAGSSELPWPEAESKLAELIAEFGPPSRTGRAQSAAYPFTRLRADGVWVLDQDVPMDLVGPLARGHFTGRLEASAESALLARPALIAAAARDQPVRGRRGGGAERGAVGQGRAGQAAAHGPGAGRHDGYRGERGLPDGFGAAG